LAEPHVVGQARPEPPSFQKREPGVPAHLVGTQLPVKSGRRRNLFERSRPVEARHEIGDPSGSGDSIQAQTSELPVSSEGQSDDLAHWKGTRSLLLPEFERRLDL